MARGPRDREPGPDLRGGPVPSRKGKGEHSPAMLQFFRAKEQYPDALLFFRMGDFYELFHDDAVVAAKALDLALTSRQKSSDGVEIPMAGVPHHAATGYLAKLLEKGFKVAICEQMADPKTVKGIVPREVVRVVTPGLALDPDALDAQRDNLLVVLVTSGGESALASLELTRADLRVCTVRAPAELLGELVRLDPREVLVVGLETESVRRALPRARVVVASPQIDPLAVIGELLGEEERGRAAALLDERARQAIALALLSARESQPRAALGVRTIATYDPGASLALDEAAIRNLELVRTLQGDRPGSLLALIDETCTSMGARLLRRRLLAPLADVAAIRRRHDAVEALVLDPPARTELRRTLGRIPDLERLATRAELGVAGPRDLGAIRVGLEAARALRDHVFGWSVSGDLLSMAAIDACTDTLASLSASLVDELPAVPTQGGMIRPGVDASLDELRALESGSKDVLLALEVQERDASGIASLKIRYTRVFGYYIEITRTNLSLVPKHFRRKQTVANGERFTTDALEDLQEKILHAEERARTVEQALFEELRARVGRSAGRIRSLASAIADLDVHAGLAQLAQSRGYARPTVDDSLVLEIEDGRHPVVESLSPAGSFVPNDVRVDAESERMLVITGPNMAGKSTLMRQTALVAILAQAGSFVPARVARVGLVDRIYTRVGASDNLGGGQSTFMVEMRETAAICAGATRRSLVVLDEIGRGTSTYDGLSIAWAVAEHLEAVIGCRALFATHYHELCELERRRPGRVANFNVAARERTDGKGDDVVFLHRLVRGGSNRSYGIAVARLAGLPESVLSRARNVLAELEHGARSPEAAATQTELFAAPRPPSPSPIEAELRDLELERITPIDALNLVARWRDLVRSRT